MDGGADGVRVAPVRVREPQVLALLDALTAELAGSGYTPEETFGYSAERLEQAGVHLVGATVGGDVVGIGGVELDPADRTGELKRFYVAPPHRGTGVADAILRALVDHATARGTQLLRLETGVHQLPAIAFYRRHGFTEIPRFGPYVDSATSLCMQRPLLTA
jgi:putative acetyltransferase